MRDPDEWGLKDFKYLDWGWRRFRLLMLFGAFLVLLIGWVFIVVKQQNGEYQTETIFLQFGDDFLPSLRAFSGTYTRSERKNGRFFYQDVNSKPAWIGYCGGSNGFWSLTTAQQDPADSCVLEVLYQRRTNLEAMYGVGI